ncbi:hypothetical protein OCH7691_04190 [Oceanibacterium hippocampi]|uniref:YjiS-like domain-containing protein n=2 Tax=Oceanibacterium hippocampi TaxID=745714 RepID=A0A1Y5TY56_9PROT|nr:hypothetical protein OCH7691_04190 [Oceanibacterium hippocampi]
MSLFSRWFSRSLTAGHVRREISALSDRELRDLGIERGQIDEVGYAMADGALVRARRARPVGRGMSMSPLFAAYVAGRPAKIV